MTLCRRPENMLRKERVSEQSHAPQVWLNTCLNVCGHWERRQNLPGPKSMWGETDTPLPCYIIVLLVSLSTAYPMLDLHGDET